MSESYAKVLNRNYRLWFLGAAILFMCCASITVLGQGMCVPEPLRIDHVTGRVLFGYEGKQRPQPDVTVELISMRNKKKVIARTVTDAEGAFKIGDIKPGNYWLRTKHKQLIGITVELHLPPTSHKNNREGSEIIFVLGGDRSKLCGGGHVEALKLAEVRN